MTPTRLALGAGALLMLSAASASAGPAYVTSTVNMRAGPATTNEIVTKIPGGSLVDANNCKDGWCEVVWQGKNGFAIATALDLSGRIPPRRAPAAISAAGADDYVPVGPPAVYGGPVYYAPYPYYRPYWGGGWGYRGGYYRRRW